MGRAWRGSVSRVTYPRSCRTAMVFAAACLETDRRRPSSEALPAPAATARLAKAWTGRTSWEPRRASSAVAVSTSERKPPSKSRARSAPERDMGEDYGSDWTVTTRLARVNDIQVVQARRRNGRHASWSRAAGDHAPLCGGQRDQAALRRGGDQRIAGPAGPRVSRDLVGLPEAHPAARGQPPGLRRRPARLR